MNRTAFYLFLFFFTSISATAISQVEDTAKAKPSPEIAIDVGVRRQNLLGNHFTGITYAIKGYATRRWVTGVYMSVSDKRISDTFHYRIAKPIVEWVEAGWLNGWDVVQTTHWRITATVLNGMASARLGDDAIKTKRRTARGVYYRSERIALNTYYLLEPGATVSYRIINSHDNGEVSLTASGGYRILAGGSKYASRGAFEGTEFGIGFSVIGYDTDGKKKTRTVQSL